MEGHRDYFLEKVLVNFFLLFGILKYEMWVKNFFLAGGLSVLVVVGFVEGGWRELGWDGFGFLGGEVGDVSWL